MGATVSALCLGIVGAVLLFAPVEAGNALMPGSSRPVLVQLIGAALLGYGIANWTREVRRSAESTAAPSSRAIKCI